MLINEQEVKLKQTKLVRRDYEKYHSYFIEGVGYVPGATTILSEGLPLGDGLRYFFQSKTLEEARTIVEQASDHGTAVHRLIELLNQGLKLSTQEHPEAQIKDCLAYIAWFREWKPAITQSEQLVAYTSETHPFAGTVDFVGKINGETWLIDWKTSNTHQLSHELQVIAYKEAYEQSYDKKIDRVGVLRLGTKHKQLGRKKLDDKHLTGPGFEFMEVNQEKYTFEDFLTVYSNYLLVNGKRLPEPPLVEELPEFIQLFEGENNSE